MSTLYRVIAFLTHPQGERGLSQSTENAVLLAGAITVATLVIVGVTTFVTRSLPK